MRLWSESWAAMGGPALELLTEGLGAPAQQKAQAQDAPPWWSLVQGVSFSEPPFSPLFESRNPAAWNW